MPTKFYLHRSFSPVGGALPLDAASVSATAPTWQPGLTNSIAPTPWLVNREMNATISTIAQTSLAYATDNVTTAQAQPLLAFASPPLAAQTIAAQNFTYSIGVSQSNTISTFRVTVVLSVWRPSTGALVGRIFDGPTAGIASGFAPGTTQLNLSATVTAAQTAGVTAQAGDILVFEVWRSNALQTMGTSYTNTFFYDGTTEASTTNNAAFLNFTNNVTLETVTPTIALRDISEGNPTNIAPWDITFPPGTTNGDFLIVVISGSYSSQLPPAASSGWTRIYAEILAPSTYSVAIYSAPYSAGLTRTFNAVPAPSGRWICGSYYHQDGSILQIGDLVGTIKATNNTSLPTGAPTTGSSVGEYEVLAYGFGSSIGITITPASGSTINRHSPQGSQPTMYVALGRNNTVSLPASTTVTAFDHTLTAVTLGTAGVGVLLKKFDPHKDLTGIAAGIASVKTGVTKKAADIYGQTVQNNSNLVAYWRLDETSGIPAADSARGLYPGGYVASPTLGVPGTNPAGGSTKAVSFNGTDQYVSIAAAVPITGAFSVEAWVKPGTWPAGAQTTLLNRMDVNGYGGFVLDVDNQGRFTFNIYEGAGLRGVGVDPQFMAEGWLNCSTTLPLDPTLWHHVVATYDGVGGYIVVDGGFDVAGNGAIGSMFNPTEPYLQIARNIYWGTCWPGVIDEVAVYNTALDMATIEDHYAKGTAPTGPGPKNITGTSAGVATEVGQPTRKRVLAGVSAGAATEVGQPTRRRALIAVSAGTTDASGTVSSLPPLNILFQDFFTRANSDTLGGNWVEAQGTLEIFDNSLRAYSFGTDLAYNTSPLGTGDYQVLATIIAGTMWDTGGRGIGLVARYQDANNYYLAWVDSTPPVIKLYRVEGGSFNVIGTYEGTTPTDPVTVSLLCDGTSLKVLGEGNSERISVTDSTFSSGYFGVRAFNAGTFTDHRFNDVRVFSLVEAGPKDITGSAAGVTFVLGSVSKVPFKNLVGTTAGTTSVSATATRKRHLVVASTGVAASTATPTRRRSLVVASAGISTVAAQPARKRLVVGTSAGVTTVSVQLRQARAIVAVAAGISTASGVVSKSTAFKDIVGSTAGSASVSIAIQRKRSVVATAVGVSATTAIATSRRLLTAASAGSATASATATKKRFVTGASAGVSTTTATATRRKSITAASAGSSTAAAQTTRRRPVTAASQGTATATSQVNVKRLLGVYSSNGLATALGVITPPFGVEDITAASAIGRTTVSATLLVKRALTVSAIGNSVVSGSIDKAGSVFRPLVATSTGSSSVAVAISRRRPLTAVSAGVASVAVSLRRKRALSAASTGVASVTATIIRKRALVAATAGLTIVNATLKARRSITALSTGVTTVSVVLGKVGFQNIVASAAGVATVSATVRRKRALTASSTGSSLTVASVGRKRVLTASTSGQTSVSAILSVKRSIVALSAGKTTANGIIDVIRVSYKDLIVSTTGIATTSATINRTRALVVLSAGKTVVSGTITKVRSTDVVSPGPDIVSSQHIVPVIYKTEQLVPYVYSVPEPVPAIVNGKVLIPSLYAKGELVPIIVRSEEA